MVALVFSAFTVLTGKIVTGMIYGAILLMILTAINIVKMMILHVPFYGWDLMYAWHLGSISSGLGFRKNVFYNRDLNFYSCNYFFVSFKTSCWKVLELKHV
jgi:hypothetical protein